MKFRVISDGLICGELYVIGNRHILDASAIGLRVMARSLKIHGDAEKPGLVAGLRNLPYLHFERVS